MSDISRRDVLRRLGLALMATGALDRVSAQEVHHMALASQTTAAGGYSPKALNDHEYRTLVRLTDLIIPVEDGKPGAVAAGAAAWIDMLASENAQLKDRYTTGLAWMDEAMKKRGAADFLSAAPKTSSRPPPPSRRNCSTESRTAGTRRRSSRQASSSSRGRGG